MILRQLWSNLLRTRRRTVLSGSLVFLAASLLVVTAAIGAGSRENFTRLTIDSISGQAQVRPLAAGVDPLRPQMGALIDDPGPLLQSLVEIGLSVEPRLNWAAALAAGDSQAGVMVVGGAFAGPGNIVVADTLADRIGVAAGDELVLLTATADGRPLSLPLVVTGVLDNGAAALFIDHIAHVDLQMLQDFLDLGAAVSEIRLSGADELLATAEEVLPPGLKVLTCRELGQLPLSIAAVGDWMYELGFLALSLVAAAGIANSFFIATAERSQELALLQALGYRPGTIMCLVLGEAVLLALLASLAGMAVTAAVVARVAQAGIDVSGAAVVFGAERFHPVLRWQPLAAIPLRLLVVAAFGALLPALAASRTNAADALKP